MVHNNLYVRMTLAAALSLAAAGCATGPTGPVVAVPPASSVRANGQPKLLPCMIGDLLCTPQT